MLESAGVCVGVCVTNTVDTDGCSLLDRLQLAGQAVSVTGRLMPPSIVTGARIHVLLDGIVWNGLNRLDDVSCADAVNSRKGFPVLEVNRQESRFTRLAITARTMLCVHFLRDKLTKREL